MYAPTVRRKVILKRIAGVKGAENKVKDPFKRRKRSPKRKEKEGEGQGKHSRIIRL
jgi:hypothetical protein